MNNELTKERLFFRTHQIKTTKTLTLRQIIVSLGLFSFFRPTIFEKNVFLNVFINALLIGSLLFVVIDFILSDGFAALFKDAFIVVSFFYYMIMVTSTLLNNGSVSRMIMYVFIGFSSILFVKYIIEKELLFAAKTMRVLTWLFVLLNIASMIIFPSGIVQTGASQGAVYLLGQPTRFAFFFFPSLLFCFIGDLKQYKRIRISTLILFSICFLCLLITWTIGSLFAMILMLFLLVFSKYKKINFVVLFALCIVLYFALTYFSIMKYFAGFIEGVLGKDLTLSSRTLIWKHGFQSISSHPYFGVGVLDNDSMRDIFSFVHLHNHLLQVTFNTGYIGLAFFLLMLFIAFVRVYKNVNKRIASIIGICILCTSVELLVDSVDGVRNHYVFLMSLGAFSHLIETKYSNNR